MTSGDWRIVVSRAVARAGTLCPRCRAQVAGGGEPARTTAAEFWDDAVEQGKAAKEYADFVCANFSAGIRSLRGRSGGMSVCDLARRTGMDRQTIGPVNNGETKPTPHTTARIAFVLCGGLMGWGRHFDDLALGPPP